jgi:putative lipoic acid-binding regulatory protein
MEPERITFPTDYPIKVVAKASDQLRMQVDAVFVRHFGEFPPHRVSERASAQSNFVALTYVMVVQTEAQLGALHAELKSLESIVMVL